PVFAPVSASTNLALLLRIPYCFACLGPTTCTCGGRGEGGRASWSEERAIEHAVPRQGTATNHWTLATAVAGLVCALAAAFAPYAQATPNLARAWGFNKDGQLGDGSTESSATPVAVSGLLGVTAVAGGSRHSLALMEDGTVKAWGGNAEGQLGDGGSEASDVPVDVRGLSGVTAVSAGFRHAIALLSNGTVMAWGENEYGQLGDGTEADSAWPVPVRNLSAVTSISAGNSHSVALIAKGKVMAWGDNEEGQLGDGSHTGPEQCGLSPLFACSKVPVEVKGLSEV